MLPDTQRTIKHPLPPQLKPGIITDTIEASAETVQTGSVALCAGNAVTNFLLAGSLNQLWGMINNLQIIIHSPLINVQFPGNAFILYDNMIVVATFDFLPTDDFFPYIFPNVPFEDAYTDKFDRLGYSHTFLLFNMGTMLIIFFYHLVCYLLYHPIKFLSSDARWANKLLHKWIIPTCFWNGSILFIQEAYLDLLIAASINAFQITNWTSWDIGFSNILTIVMLVLSIALPLFTLLFIWPNY